jgi:hypothetical protein
VVINWNKPSAKNKSFEQNRKPKLVTKYLFERLDEKSRGGKHDSVYRLLPLNLETEKKNQ